MLYSPKSVDFFRLRQGMSYLTANIQNYFIYCTKMRFLLAKTAQNMLKVYLQTAQNADLSCGIVRNVHEVKKYIGNNYSYREALSTLTIQSFICLIHHGIRSRICCTQKRMTSQPSRIKA